MGDKENFYFGFSTYGFDDIIKNGGKEIMEAAYKDYLNSGPSPFENAKLSFAVNRSIMPAKQSFLLL